MRGVGSRIAIGLCIVALGFVACKKQAPATSAPGGEATTDEAAAESPHAEPATEADLDAMLADLDKAQSELAVEMQRPVLDAESSNQASRCERICGLAEAVCDLEGRICALADDHRGEDRYLAACARAGEQCKTGSEACRACSP